MRRQRPERSGRSILLLSSVLALLASACFPVFAQALTEYDPYLPKPGNEKKGQKEEIAKAQKDPQTGGAEAPTATAPEGEAMSDGGSEDSSESEGSGAAGGKGGNTGQGSPDKGADRGDAAGLQPNAPVNASGTESEDDGSSPLLPILIGVLVLAAISVAAVMIRQRRSRDAAGPSLSTKAG